MAQDDGDLDLLVGWFMLLMATEVPVLGLTIGVPLLIVGFMRGSER